MGQVSHEATINAPREQVFAYVDDYRNVPEYFFGLDRFTPVTEQTSGLGAEFKTVLKVGPKEITSTVRCTDWAANEIIKLESIAGMGADTTWAFADGAEPGTTRLSVDFTYHLPGGLAGKVLGKLMGPFADQAVKHSENKIREVVEA